MFEVLPLVVASSGTVSTATCWLYVTEVVELQAGRAPKLGSALRKAKRLGVAYVRGDRPDADPDRLGRRRPALLLQRTQDTRGRFS